MVGNGHGLSVHGTDAACVLISFASSHITFDGE
jgi:hypothetical protein